MELVLKNAQEKLGIGMEKAPKALIELGEALGLEGPPLRKEGVDMSDTGGGDAVGTLVTFSQGRADKKNYRRYKIRSVEGIDDYAMIREVVRRRYQRLMSEGKKLPDLVVIDGGKVI